MSDSDINRIARITAILTQLQSKRIFTSKVLAEKFKVSVRTIYRDIRVLEQAGVPILTAEGKGYSLLEGYRIPPVMFTEAEAKALVTIQHLVFSSGDKSLVSDYVDAVSKIKAVLPSNTKDKLSLLESRIAVSTAIKPATTDSFSLIQSALTSFKVLRMSYHSEYNNKVNERDIEPFAFYYTLKQSWALIAYCRLRSDFRMFNLDRIKEIMVLDVQFIPHNLTLSTYLKEKEKNYRYP
jgi:predicted DNA-binding transcriptional regulator YafY